MSIEKKIGKEIALKHFTNRQLKEAEGTRKQVYLKKLDSIGSAIKSLG